MSVKMNNKLIRVIFWAMVAVFIIIVGSMFIRIPTGGEPRVYNMLLPGIAVFFILGVALLTLTVKTKIEGKLKTFLLLTGASSVGLLVFTVLHNIVSGLFSIEEPVFFILATIICPLGFLVGAIGTIVLMVKSKGSGRMSESE
jgi:hypothetical protein